MVLAIIFWCMNQFWLKSELVQAYEQHLIKTKRKLINKEYIRGIYFIPGIINPFHYRRDALETYYNLDENRHEIVNKFRKNFIYYNTGVSLCLLTILY